MQQALRQFQSNIQRARSLVAIHNALKAYTSQALEISDILRSALVMAVSALDHYVHEVVRLGILEIYRGQRTDTGAFLKFNVSLGSVRQSFVTSTGEEWLDREVRERHSWQSLENPDRIAEAIRLISDVRLWDTVAATLGRPSGDVTTQLRLIVDRRNKIAHEADMDPSFPDTRWPINDRTVLDAITFIEQVVDGIHMAISTPVRP